MVQKPPRQETLTNSQVSLLSGVSDPTQKFFLLQMFRDKIGITQSIKTKVYDTLKEDQKSFLQQALHRLQQKYASLSNTNSLNQMNQDRILQEYFDEIKPIYAKYPYVHTQHPTPHTPHPTPHTPNLPQVEGGEGEMKGESVTFFAAVPHGQP